MKHIKHTPTPLAAGQVWETDDSTIEITLVGKTLVHYKKAPHGVKRVPNSLLGKETLEKFMRENGAVLRNGGQFARQTKLRVSTKTK